MLKVLLGTFIFESGMYFSFLKHLEEIIHVFHFKKCNSMCYLPSIIEFEIHLQFLSKKKSSPICFCRHQHGRYECKSCINQHWFIISTFTYVTLDHKTSHK